MVDNSSSRILPAAPTKGRPTASSQNPGASPINISDALRFPSPGTKFFACFHKRHLRQTRTSATNFSISSCLDTKLKDTFVLLRICDIVAIISWGCGLNLSRPRSLVVSSAQYRVIQVYRVGLFTLVPVLNWINTGATIFSWNFLLLLEFCHSNSS